MRRAEWLVIAFLALAVLGAVAVGVSGTVAAEGNETANESAVVAEVDEDVRVTDYEHRSDEDVFAVTLENAGSSRSSVTITEVVDTSSSGSGTFGVEQLTLRGDETATVEISLSSSGSSAGVMITTDRSLANGHGTHLTSSDGISLFSGSATWGDVRAGIGFAIAFSAVVLIVAVWHIVSVKNNEVEQVSLDA